MVSNTRFWLPDLRALFNQVYVQSTWTALCRPKCDGLEQGLIEMREYVPRIAN